MRKTTPKLVLQGNTILAKKWIPWATKALDRIKNLTGVVNQILRPVTGVAVHVRSVNNIDFIRIAVALAEKCKMNFTAVQQAGSSPWPVLFTPAYTTEDGQTSSRAFWDFGDGNDDSIIVSSPQLHQYDNTGIYSVFARGWTSKFTITGHSAVHTPGLTTITTDMGGNTKVILFARALGTTSSSLIDLYANNVFIHTWTGVSGGYVLIGLSVPADPMVVEFRITSGAEYPFLIPQVFYQAYSCTATKTKTITVV